MEEMGGMDLIKTKMYVWNFQEEKARITKSILYPFLI